MVINFLQLPRYISKRLMHTNFRIVTLVISCLMASNLSLASNLCHPSDPSASADNQEFINFWRTRLQLLNDGIPELSPRDSAWLDNEIKIGGADIKTSKRWLDAMNSKEQKLRVVKRWTNSMMTTTKFWKDTPANWMILSLYFLSQSETEALMSLVNAGVIKREILPYEWTVFGDESITSRQIYYARSIIGCNMPKSLKIDIMK
jgi:hypothetical protein